MSSALFASWSECWKLNFSLEKSQLVVFNNKRYAIPSPRRELALCDEAVSVVAAYKYLGLLMDENGSHVSHADALISKTTYTAYVISRIFSRNRPPSPLIALSLVRSILIPQITYGLPFISLTKKHKSRLTQILATPLRAALGVGKHGSALRVLWEFAIPDLNSLQLQSLLSTLNRSFSCLRNGLSLPGLLASDVESFVPSRSTLCFRPLPHVIRNRLAPFLEHFPAVASFPISPKLLHQVVQRSMTDYWSLHSRPPHRSIKPLLPLPRYLSIDPKPTVCIRA